MIKIAARLASINEYYFSQKLREIDALNKAGKAVINLGIGSPDLPPHPSVIQALTEAALQPDVHTYQSYKGSPILRKAISTWYERYYAVTLDPEQEVLPLIGSKEGIMHLCMTYLQNGDEALIPDPGYPTYRSAVTLAGARAVPYDLKAENDWYPDFEALEKMDLSRVKLLFANYPAMPTGQPADADIFRRLIAFARSRNILIIHDNPYSFILNDKPMSMLAYDTDKNTVLELNSLSKSHSMAGWRVGMLVGSGARLEEILRFKSNMDSGMFLPVQLAATEALSLGPEYHRSINEIYIPRRLRAAEILETLGCVCHSGQQGLFLWARIPAAYSDSYAFSDAILHRCGVFITPGAIFGRQGEPYIRLSLCAPEETIQEALDRIKMNPIL